MRELWLARHAESVGNVAATRAEVERLEVIPLDVRDADVDLSPTGVEQARALGDWLQPRVAGFDSLWSSPYARARRTLAIALGEELGEERGERVVLADERLRDRELGVLDLLTHTGVAARFPGEVARRRHLGKFYHRPPGGESWADIALRLRSFFGDFEAAAGERAFVMAHDAIVMVSLYVLLGLSETELLEFARAKVVGNASVTHLERVDGRWRLVEFGDVGHLRVEGAPVTAHPGADDVTPR
ncbi:broad specificity phosphatase PhoE [Agromyces sp. 3263]|uniref:histidine phosphatase family protein n=1 Tax=Agromyces sp. 3263 TaxID=2817750 RepID=UPI0028558257|nr:histidine phosphatase family protein [Agromyces sp. 3263]MDR6905771.1 broad specificity phosphatase PhoE [Agromyces sp. 3263]